MEAVGIAQLVASSLVSEHESNGPKKTLICVKMSVVIRPSDSSL